MLRLLLTLLFIFLTFCVLYGIATGTNTAIQGFLRTRQKFSKSLSEPASKKSLSDPSRLDERYCTVQQGIVEIKSLFDLHKAGALTREEFDMLKQRPIFNHN